MLEVKNLFCSYDNVDIIKNVSFKVEKGKNLCIVGPNGCGKSTLLKSIANIIDYRGSIKIDNDEVNTLSRKQLATKIALMSQISQIYFPYSIYETVSLGRYAHSSGIFNSLNKKDKELILDSIDKVGLLDIKDKPITELSGGQLQRVFLARTFAQDPDVILLDEPTNHLDLKYQIELLKHLSTWAKEKNKIVIGVLHDLNLVHFFSDDVCLVNNGEIVAYGKSRDVFKGDNLKEIYKIDVAKFMIEVLEKWK
ncbi:MULTISPECIES: ABC transporter ATP-binding protein [Romboutsia]|uniref:Iron(3+)-hydroxamate import ATP-binding protein FhuC n=1 Tax=Romboutsia hominis TaxID=1507512 RepID=A0A2P2BVD8_9FIRM|nr:MULTISPECIES: ABC transporter ATP-binding protein [Romboutsia]MDB8791745.1 ABC transporter ATP-binding protein [Romboutsia sp. 1001216sp1]MDB8794248.1 ABC transporter ATP-binding protein [Romboutsia sp. 1001216sp1]MDB8796417.1 ABC transporter ATP-binding protein [Romboutsia sp. 1001216sp1]MDB8797830.1 ABC transporter ATP-binding protein [Romboutsia sp. 1001216sp1]MDB8801438.1 ABC transporter ATP-binding protein [Romboutsia sp. 1001216sp1]